MNDTAIRARNCESFERLSRAAAIKLIGERNFTRLAESVGNDKPHVYKQLWTSERLLYIHIIHNNGDILVYISEEDGIREN